MTNDRLNEIAELAVTRCIGQMLPHLIRRDILRAMQEWGDMKSDSDNDCLVQGNLMLQQQLEAAKADVARLVDALTKLRDCDFVITPHDSMDAVREIARAAIDAARKEAK